MTSAAWIMLAVTWACVSGFTGYFFLKVLRSRTAFSGEETAQGAADAHTTAAD